MVAVLAAVLVVVWTLVVRRYYRRRLMVIQHSCRSSLTRCTNQCIWDGTHANGTPCTPYD